MKLFPVLFIAMLASAKDHKELNGTWVMDAIGGQSGTVTIQERESNITVSRNFAYEGAEGTVFYRDMVDSRNNATIKAGKDMKSKARWDHDVLKVTTTVDGATTEEAFSLAADGVMNVYVSGGGHPEKHLTFHRQ